MIKTKQNTDNLPIPNFRDKSIYNPGDIVIERWEVKGEQVLTGKYLIYARKIEAHSHFDDIASITYKAYVMYTHDPYGREDKSGLMNVGDTHEFIHWNDMDIIDPDHPCFGRVVVQSGLTWDDVE